MNQQSYQSYFPDDRIFNSAHRPTPPRYETNRFWKRLILFAVVFAVCAILSLAFTFKRPAIYESSSLLLIEPKDPNTRDQDTSAYDIALQEQVLLSRNLLTTVSKSLSLPAYTGDMESLKFSSLRPMLRVTTQADSAVVQLTAEGPQKTVLPIIVNTWVDCYVDMNSQMQQSYSDAGALSLKQQIDTLKNKIDAKREELESFRDKYDIVTLEREGNKVLSKLKGLNASLNKATENRSTAEANLRAVKEAIEQGKWAGNYKKTIELLRLEEKAEEMEELVRDYKARYTSKFLEIDKNTKTIIDRYNRLEEEIQLKYLELQTAALEEAKQAVVSSRHAENNLKAQILAFENEAAEFSSRFSEYESLKEDLQGLEKLSRDYQEKLVAMEIKSDADLLQVKVLEKAFIPEAPSRPNYMRDAGISIFGSLLLSIVAVLIFDFLTKPISRQDVQSSFAVRYNQVFQNQPLPLPVDPQTKQNLLPPMHEALPRELSDMEIKRLYTSSDDMTRVIIAGLLSGLGSEENIQLKWADINFDEGNLKTHGDSARIVPLSDLYRSVLLKYRQKVETSKIHVLQNEMGAPLSVETFEDHILRAAKHAEILEPQQITAHALRHTYISFLARQGVRIGEIAGRVGWIPSHHYTAYQIMAPPGTGISIVNAQQVLPALEEFV